MNLWEVSIGRRRPIYGLIAWYLRHVPVNWLKEYLFHGVIGHAPRFSSFTNNDGIHFELDLDDCVQKGIFCFNYYEPEDILAFRRFVRPGGVVFDVGANVGQYSLLASKLVGKNGHVYAFEPSPRVLKRLLRHLEINDSGNIELVRKAVSDRNGTAKFYPAKEESNQGVGSLLPPSEFKLQAREDKAIDVEMITLDSFCDTRGIERIDVLKIDAEGYDLDVLKGAEMVLSRSPNIVVMAEVQQQWLGQRGLTTADFMGYIAEQGFKAYYTTSRGRLIPLRNGDNTKPNLFFKRS